MDRMNCVTALSKINLFAEPVIFRLRPPGRFNAIFLPLRYLSDDGHCAIDVSLKDGHYSDVGNGIGIYHAAQRVIQQCLKTRTAGFAADFSKSTFPMLPSYSFVRC